MEIPNSMYAWLTDRSSLAIKGIIIRGGDIDSNYRGNIMICLHNSTDKEITLTTGTRIGQMIFEKHGTPYIIAVDHLRETTWQEGWFGSTNKPTPTHGQRTHTHHIDDSRVIIATDGFQKTQAKVVTIPVVVPDNVKHQNAHNDTSNIAHEKEDSQEDLITI